MMKKLNEKNPEKLEMEKKEQGFSLYLNGENAKKRKGPVKSDKLRKSTSYDTKQDTSVQRHQGTVLEAPLCAAVVKPCSILPFLPVCFPWGISHRQLTR